MRSEYNDPQLVAKCILAQLGGNQFVAMTGARQLVSDYHSLQFGVGRNHAGVNKVRIVHNGADLYDMYCYKIRNLEVKLLSQDEDIYAEDLRKVFTERTGLDTHL